MFPQQPVCCNADLLSFSWVSTVMTLCRCSCWARLTRLHTSAVHRRPTDLLRRAVHHVGRAQRRRAGGRFQSRRRWWAQRWRCGATGCDRRDTAPAEADRFKDGVRRQEDRRRSGVAASSRCHRPMSVLPLSNYHRRQLHYRSRSRSSLLASALARNADTPTLSCDF